MERPSGENTGVSAPCVPFTTSGVPPSAETSASAVLGPLAWRPSAGPMATMKARRPPSGDQVGAVMETTRGNPGPSPLKTVERSRAVASAVSSSVAVGADRTIASRGAGGAALAAGAPTAALASASSAAAATRIGTPGRR